MIPVCFRAVLSLAFVALAASALSACQGPRCGDGRAEGWEHCDGDDFAGMTCEGRGYGSGTISCTSTCTFDLGNCVPREPPRCGDGVRQGDEQCDGDPSTPLDLLSCLLDGYEGGFLSCDVDCRYDYSTCSCENCLNGVDDNGNGLVDCNDPSCLDWTACPDELCYDGVDNDDDGLIDCEDPDCATNAPACNGGCFPREDLYHDSCGNGLDDDCDGFADANDLDCAHAGSVLLIRDENCGRIEAGDRLSFELRLFGNGNPWSGALATLPLEPFFTDVVTSLDGSWDASAMEVRWHVPPVALGEAVTLTAFATVVATLLESASFCLQASIDGSGPALSYVSDDRGREGVDDANCMLISPL